MKGSANISSKSRSGFLGETLPERQNRLKSERVQLELETDHRVRKIVQRGAQGRFIPPRVLAAEPPGLRVSLRFLAEGDLVVTAWRVPEVQEGPAVPAEEVARAAA